MKRNEYHIDLVRTFAIGLLALTALLTQGIAQAQVSNNVDIRYDEGDFIVDFSGFAWRDDVEAAVLMSCTSVDVCNEHARITTFSNYSFRYARAGLFKLELRRANTWWVPNFVEVLWEQFIANITAPSAELIAAAERHAPLFSFHERNGVAEEYFPIGLGALFGQPIESFLLYDTGVASALPVNTRCTAASIICADPGTPASRFMAGNGHHQLSLFLRPELARVMRGSATDFPVYWYSEQNGDAAWVTYAVFYAYDQKRNEYVTGGALGNHAVDRESVTVRHSRIDGKWQPMEVIYAGHLEEQDTSFKGCGTLPACERAGNLSVSWSQGRTKLPWTHAAKRGNRPIVYVADGSHAIKPAFGWYSLDVAKSSLIDVTEPAGSVSIANLRSGRLTQLDLNNTAHAALKFSGYLIDALGNSRVFPFVRFPISDWAAAARGDMESCASNECGSYIHNLPLITDLAPTSAFIGQSTEFTLHGENLAPFLVEATNCSAVTFTLASADEVRFRCMPDGSGNVNVTIRRSSTEEVLDTRTVPVTDNRPTVSSFTVAPDQPRVGIPLTLTVTGTNLRNSGLRFSNLPPCSTGGAVNPSIIEDLRLQYTCIPTSVANLSFVGIIGADGQPVPGFGQPLKVYCADGREPEGGVCDTPVVSIPSPSFSLDLSAVGLASAGAVGGGYTLIESNGGRPAVRFSGGSAIRIPNRASLQFSSGATFDFWARIDSDTGMTGYGNYSTSQWAMTLIAKSHDTIGFNFNAYPPDANYPGAGYGMSLFSTYDTSYTDPSCSTFVKRNPGKAFGQWYRVTGVLSPTSGIRVYADKELIFQCAAARVNFSQANSQDLYIGGGSSGFWYPLTGAVQDLRIYQSDLTDAQVKALP